MYILFLFVCSFLIDMYSRFEFILFSVLLRVVEGIGSAGYATALFTMATVLYPKSTGTVIVSETEKKEGITCTCITVLKREHTMDHI